MSDTAPSARPPGVAPRAGRAARSRLLRVLLAALVAGLAGAFIASRTSKPATTPRFSTRMLHSPMAISLLLWVIFSIYWEVAARTASATKSSESRGSRALHLTLVNVAMVLSFWPFPGWLDPGAPAFAFPRVLPSAPYLAPLGLSLVAASLLFAVWARRHLAHNWSGAVTVKVDHELVRSGPYRRIRHPIYTGVLGAHVGVALISGRLQGPLAVALVLIAYARKIRLEERYLSEVFGPAYDEYRRQSWALIPGLI